MKQNIGRCMCRHNQRAKNNWDLLIIFLALYNAILLPLEFAFSPDFLESIYYVVLEYIFDFLFFMDIVVTFWTTYVNKKTGMEIHNKCRIAIQYVFFGRFIIDVAATIPFELFINMFVSNLSGNFKLLGLLKLIRLLRLGRIVTFLKVKSSFKSTFKILQLLFLLLMLVHWTACIWYLFV